MELRELAERVLFSSSLEEKLRCPEIITDEVPGSAIVAPAMPGRPTQLTFKPQGSGSGEFPALHHLERERERGRLLHFFANHELLATELMALVLLRFPDAPAAFRRGVLQTLKDEQEHTRWYMDRMRTCGIEFGELPVSGYFWRAVSGMENPIDYVAGLCLTFEQANLDYARHFAQGFSTVGDADSARLLDRIYRDEIGHVAYGLKWFRKWKNPSESDWDAFCRVLKFPLSPQRAKGFRVNVEGRRAAGLEPQFIDALNVYAQSKGRTPTVFLFNPLAEGYIARGSALTPKKQQAQLARDLECLPQFLCRRDDVVLVTERPSLHHLSVLKQAGFALPEFATDSATLTERKLGGLRPWAWSPDSVKSFGPLFSSVTAGQSDPARLYNPQIGALYGKAWSAEFLRRYLPTWNGPWLCTENEAGVVCSTASEVMAAIERIRGRGHHKVVIKESLGLAGQNALRLWEPEILDVQRRWIENAVASGQVVVEPWLERLFDFSVQFDVTERELKLVGYTALVTDAKGHFQANWAAPNFSRRVPSAVTRAITDPPDIASRLHHLYQTIADQLAPELRAVGYVGPLGIDAFVYRDADGKARLKPIVEINPRYTMGRLTLELMKHAAPGTYGLYRLINRATLRASGAADFQSFARKLCGRSPIQLEGEPVARIASGAVCLTDPERAQVCMATFEVSRAERRGGS